MVSLVVADRNDIWRAGVAALLTNVGHSITEARTSNEFLSALASQVPDAVIISDEFFDCLDTNHWQQHIRPQLRVILIVKEPEPVLFRDADGIILRDATADQLLACIDSVCAGHRWADPVLLNRLLNRPVPRTADGQLTNREFQISALIGRGFRNKEIARQMKVSEATVKMHLHHIYEKLNLNGRTELALLARDLREAADNRLGTLGTAGPSALDWNAP